MIIRWIPAKGVARHAGLPEQEMPPWMLSMDYKLVWYSDQEQTPIITVWRPVAPAGYSPLSDVISLGLDPPAEPVRYVLTVGCILH